MSSTAAEWDWCGSLTPAAIAASAPPVADLCLNAEVHRVGSRRGYAELVTAHRDFLHPLPEGDATAGPVALRRRDRIQESAGGRYWSAVGRRQARSLRLRRVGDHRDPGGDLLGLRGPRGDPVPAEVQRAYDLGATWAGTYDQPLPHLDAAVTFAPAGCGDQRPQSTGSRRNGGDQRHPPRPDPAVRLRRPVVGAQSAVGGQRDARGRADFLSVVGPAGVQTQFEVLPLDDAPGGPRGGSSPVTSGAFVLVCD